MKIGKRCFIALLIMTVIITAGILSACDKTPRPSADPTTSPSADTYSGPKYVAHRGYSSSFVGNTEDAFRAAASKGFYGIETDIRRTKDGRYVCNHDADVVYADDSRLTIANTNLTDLLAKPLKNDKTDNDAYLCTFETYLAACKSGNKVAVIELKDWFNTRELSEILSIVDNEYDRKKVWFISFYLAPLLEIKQADPSLEIQYLSQKANDPMFERCLTEELSIDVRQTVLTEDLVQTFHESGLKVNVWTINEESDLQVVYDMGVDYVTTDVFYGD